MNNILDKCIFIKCPLKETCLRFAKHRREGQEIVFRYNGGCKNYFNKRHYIIKGDDLINLFNDGDDEWMPDGKNIVDL